MWDKPHILNAIANACFALALFATALTVVVFVARMPAFALHDVRITETPAHVTREQIEAVVRNDVDGNFFTVDLEHLRNGFAQIPWVRVASVRRVWPARIEVALEEQVPLAHWNNTQLVNTYGEVFYNAGSPRADALQNAGLLDFYGPDDSAAEVKQQYETFRAGLAAIDQTPQKVELSARQAWRITLASGMVIELGREDTQRRLARFIAAWPRMNEQLATTARASAQPVRVDLRYTNGFAVRTAEQS